MNGNKPTELHAFLFIGNTFTSNTRLKLAKNQTSANQHPEAELLLFENLSHSSVRVIVHILKNKQKIKCVCIQEIVRLIIMIFFFLSGFR